MPGQGQNLPAKPKKQRLISPLLMLFMGTMILANIASFMIFPLESLFVQDLGASIKQVGVFYTVAAVAPLLFQLFGGWLSDSIGRLKAIAIGSMAGALSYLFYIFAPSWEWVLPASVLTAMAIAFVAPSYQAFIAEQSTEETRGQVYGITSGMFMVVGIIGPSIGGYVAQSLSFRMLFIVAAGLYTTAAVIRVLMAWFAGHPPGQGQKTDEKKGFAGFKASAGTVFGMVIGGGILSWIFLSDGVRDFAFQLSMRLMPLYLENEISLGLLQIGALQSVSAIAAMLVVVPGGRLSDKKGERVGIVGGFSLIAAGWTIFLLGKTFPHFVIAWLVIGAGRGLIDPAYSSLISKVVPERLRGTAFGLFSTSFSLISLPAPWIGAQLWDAFTPRTPFALSLIAIVILLPVMWVKFQQPDKRQDRSDRLDSLPGETSPNPTGR